MRAASRAHRAAAQCCGATRHALHRPRCRPRFSRTTASCRRAVSRRAAELASRGQKLAGAREKQRLDKAHAAAKATRARGARRLAATRAKESRARRAASPAIECGSRRIRTIARSGEMVSCAIRAVPARRPAGRAPDQLDHLGKTPPGPGKKYFFQQPKFSLRKPRKVDQRQSSHHDPRIDRRQSRQAESTQLDDPIHRLVVKQIVADVGHQRAGRQAAAARRAPATGRTRRCRAARDPNTGSTCHTSARGRSRQRFPAAGPRTRRAVSVMTESPRATLLAPSRTTRCRGLAGMFTRWPCGLNHVGRNKQDRQNSKASRRPDRAADRMLRPTPRRSDWHSSGHRRKRPPRVASI